MTGFHRETLIWGLWVWEWDITLPRGRREKSGKAYTWSSRQIPTRSRRCPFLGPFSKRKKKKRWGEGKQIENRGTNERHLSLSLIVRISTQNVTVSTSNILNFYGLCFIQEHLAWLFFSFSWNLPAQELTTFSDLLPLDQNLRSRMFTHLKGTRPPRAEANPKGKSWRSGGCLRKASSVCATISPGKAFWSLPYWPNNQTEGSLPCGISVQYTPQLAPESTSDFRGKDRENLSGCLCPNLNFCDFSEAPSSQLENEKVGLRPKGTTQGRG